MKNLTEPLIAARTRLTDLQAEILHLESFQGSNSVLLREEMLTCDLSTGEGLKRTMQMTTQAAIIPVRLEDRRSKAIAAERDLIQAVNTFAASELNPRARAAQSKASAKIRGEWKPHYPNSALLDIALAQSSQLNQFAAVCLSLNDNPSEGALNFAQNALNAWEKLAELEAQTA